MNPKKTSKFLSLILRHKPETIGIQLDSQGWANIDTLLEKLKEHGHPLNRTELEQIVAENNKKRFKISEDGRNIRASQGHSISVDLKLEPQKPPTVLYHGTTDRFIEAIRNKGLLKMNRQHVHLSLDKATANMVGSRHGKPVILTIQSAKMQDANHQFFLSDNQVWLTDHVPPDFIDFPEL